MKPIAEQVKAFLEANELSFSLTGEENVFRFTISGKHVDLSTVIQINEEQEYIACYTSIPVKVPEEAIFRVLEAVNDLNTNTLFASMYYNKNDRCVHSQSFVNVDDGALNMKILHGLIFPTIKMADDGSDKVLKAIYGNSTGDLDHIIAIEEKLQNSMDLN